MKPFRFVLFLVLLAGSSPALAQSPHAHEAAGATAPDAQQAFEQLKTLAGSWTGRLTTTPTFQPVEGRFVQFSLRVTSRGNALAHELSVSGLPDHPLSMFYIDGDRLALTHYCDAGNRPRMLGKLSPDGKTLEFEFRDLSGSDDNGHMHRAVFTFIDNDHHMEEWTYMGPGNAPVRARFELQRTNFESAPTR